MIRERYRLERDSMGFSNVLYNFADVTFLLSVTKYSLKNSLTYLTWSNHCGQSL